jgi:hypothetical protein
MNAHNITRVSLAHVEGKHLSDAANEPPLKTGWPAPDLAQDDHRGLSRWFASKPDARLLACESSERIASEPTTADAITPLCRFCGQHPAEVTHPCPAFEQSVTAPTFAQIDASATADARDAANELIYSAIERERRAVQRGIEMQANRPDELSRAMQGGM